MLALAAGALPAGAVEPAAPSEELLEYLGTWNGDEDWLHSDEVVAAVVQPPQRREQSSGEGRREDPASSRERTEQDR
jgi:hypothetical protein